jgi:hypothetical protein
MQEAARAARMAAQEEADATAAAVAQQQQEGVEAVGTRVQLAAA